MSLVAPVEDGKVVETASQSSMKKTKSTSNGGMDKDAFLQLLVAQMKYQDPLEPTSNTEFVSQYAQFSQVEQLQNMAGSMDLQRASQLVGQEVRVKTTNTSGDTNYVEGKVDYVAYENGKAYLSIGGNMYAMDDLDTIADAEYLEAYNLAIDWVTALNKLPSVANISMDDAESIDKLKEIYDGMSDYQKSFIASDKVKELNEYLERLEAVRKAAEEAEDGKTEDTEEPDKTEDTEPAGGADDAAGE
ncbi:MAG: flagellar hook capping protein [Acetatifactor sp.]|nr:flagellar hook capping protein [Acetatifactor sp.]